MLDILSNSSYRHLKVSAMKQILKDMGSTFSLPRKDDYIKRLDLYHNCINFTWREDQKKVITEFLDYKFKNFVIHAIFGSGKTTLLLGLLLHGIMKQLFKPEDCMFVSFNISIKNEIKRKLKEYGIGSKIEVRTFDSIVYEISKIGNYPYIDLPNYEGKRKFVYELCFDDQFNHTLEFQPKIIFIDECQDLEKQTLAILNRFFPESKFVFAGDIFQSIQKEPRESILWHFMTNESDDTFKIYMNVTPRVPPPVLNSLKKALQIYYPEFKEKISNWRSDNKISDVDIEWKTLHSYSHIFDELKDFTNTYKPQDSMILTFSSAITVKGAMGDIARVRRFFMENNIPVNTNHKKLDPKTYFLSTANSSKGLERDYVIIFLTFPLERAFVNLSDDVTMNLITVALTRAKKKVIMYVPAYEDKYSRALTFFEKCPEPTKPKLREGKTIKEFAFQDYIDIEHSVTQLIRLSVIKYDTRIRLKSFTKMFEFGKIFDSDIKHKLYPIVTEEEKAFVGVLIENLITSSWIGAWPQVDNFKELESNPMYIHVIPRIKKSYANYLTFIGSNLFTSSAQFQGIYLYSQIHTAISNKIFIKLSDGMSKNLEQYWVKLKPKALAMKPKSKQKIDIQSRVRMPWVTGVADIITTSKDKKETELYEIKASQDFEWKDDALLQVICYSLMTGKSWTRLHILNPFRNEKVSYYFNSKTIMSLRNEIIQDVLVYNTNAMMAKLYPSTKSKEKISIVDNLFMYIDKSDKGQIRQISILNMVSPIKCEFVYNKYVNIYSKKEKKMSKVNKLGCESQVDENTLIKEVNEILNSNVYKDKKVYTWESNSKIQRNTISIKEMFDFKNFDEIISFLKYEKNTTEDKLYALDFSDAYACNILTLSYLFFNRNFS